MTETENPPAGRRGRPRSVDESERRTAILDAAGQVFVDHGFGGATMARVAAKARVSKRSIYEHFENRTQLFAEVVRRHRHLILDLPRPAEEDLPLLETLTRIFRLDIPDTEEKKREAILNLIVRESSRFPELSDYLYEHQIVRAREDLVAWLDLEHCRGRIRMDDSAVCSGMLMDIVFGALLPRRRLKTSAERAERREHIRKRLAIFINGVNTAGP